MNIRDYLKNNILICDGAMGTYYSQITGNDSVFCELSNITRNDIIEKIHTEYIDAGARLIRTNTFSANRFTLKKSRSEIDSIIRSSVTIARKASEGKDIFIGASIGPIRNDEIEDADNLILEEYKLIIDVFLSKDIDIFIFETFSNTLYVEEICKYIKSKNKDAFIFLEFAIKPDGFSRDGISADRLLKAADKINEIDVLGLNCASGPTITAKNVKNLNYKSYGHKLFCVMPNAGFPMVVHERSIFTDNPDFFAKKVKEILDEGVSIVGGCCGTKPSYIKAISEIIHKENQELFVKKIKAKTTIKINENTHKDDDDSLVKNEFLDKIKQGKFVTAIELSAPIDTDIKKIMHGALLCKDNNIDLVTVPDSPMGRVRADSVIIASKIKREINIDAMPHICCRDKNINAIRSSLIGANIENIRNILAITGDPVCDAKTSETKGVFNLNSYKLIKLINDTNIDLFGNNKMAIGAALNLNVINKESEYQRMKKKIENGAEFFLTQPIYSDDAIEYIKKIKKETGAKILGGVLPIVSYKNAMFLSSELPGVRVPKSIVSMFKEDMTREEAQEVGTNISARLGRKLKEVCDGLYFITPFNRVQMVIDIINKIK